MGMGTKYCVRLMVYIYKNDDCAGGCLLLV